MTNGTLRPGIALALSGGRSIACLTSSARSERDHERCTGYGKQPAWSGSAWLSGNFVITSISLSCSEESVRHVRRVVLYGTSLFVVLLGLGRISLSPRPPVPRHRLPRCPALCRQTSRSSQSLMLVHPSGD
jgi:hypothetical protein